MLKSLHYFLLLAPAVLVGIIGLIDKYGVARDALLAAVGLAWLILLSQPRKNHRGQKTGRCAYCGYNLGGDQRHPNYCPRCGSSQLQEAHRLRRRELMLEMERLQMEMVRNHRDQIAQRFKES